MCTWYAIYYNSGHVHLIVYLSVIDNITPNISRAPYRDHIYIGVVMWGLITDDLGPSPSPGFSHCMDIPFPRVSYSLFSIFTMSSYFFILLWNDFVVAVKIELFPLTNIQTCE